MIKANMFAATIIFILPLAGYFLFYYLIIKSAQRDIQRWRDRTKKEMSNPLNIAVFYLRSAREKLRNHVKKEERE